MIALPFALSLSNSVTDIGAIAAFAALFGIAILSLLVFSQAREIKRLREWAGRAPERAAEAEQRVSADAAARMQRAGAPAAARVVPRKTPLVSAPVSTAVNATAAATAVTGPPAPAPASPLAQGPVSANPAAPSSPAAPDAQPPVGDGSAEEQSAGADAPGVAQQAAEGLIPGSTTVSPALAQDRSSAEPDLGGTPAKATPMPASSAPANDVPAGERAGADTGTDEQSEVEQLVGAPATAAARAGGMVGRAALPPSPAKPAPPGASSSASTEGGSTGAIGSSRPPASVAAANRAPSRTASAVGVGAPPRSPLPPKAQPAGVAATTAARAAFTREPLASDGGSGPKYFRPERSSARPLALIAGGVIVVVLLLVLAVSVLKGGGGGASTATQSSSSLETRPSSSQTTSTTSHAVISNPAETAVAVLNGTSTSGLAHHLAADLQQGGYTRAVALAGVPPGTHSVTVVQYAHGHRADAQAVAKSLNVAQVQAIETTIASLAGSATVVVLAGADQASLLGGGGAQSNGEPAATAGSGQ